MKTEKFMHELKLEGGRQVKAAVLKMIQGWDKKETFNHKQVVGLISSVKVEKEVR